MPFRFNKYEASTEAHEMGDDESIPFQTAMVTGQRTILMKREVAKMMTLRASRNRSVRLAARHRALRLLLGLEGGSSPPVVSGCESGKESKEDLSLKGRKRLYRPAESEDEGSSEDDPRLAGLSPISR